MRGLDGVSAMGAHACACTSPFLDRSAFINKHFWGGVRRASHPGDELYHASSPALSNDTLLVAGAGLVGAICTLCLDFGCAKPAGPAASVAWESSVKVTLPATGCGPPCFLRVQPLSGDPITIAVNEPDVWWAAPGSPSSVPPGEVLAQAIVGDQLRVFDRSLAWTSSWCGDGSAPPLPNANTTLLLLSGTSIYWSIPSSAASCYEASFSTAALPLGDFSASLQTSWGTSPAFALRLLPSPPPVIPSELDVLAGFAGNLTAALAVAAQIARAGGTTTVLLGSYVSPCRPAWCAR